MLAPEAIKAKEPQRGALSGSGSRMKLARQKVRLRPRSNGLVARERELGSKRSTSSLGQARPAFLYSSAGAAGRLPLTTAAKLF